MRKLKLFFACLLMAVLSIGQMWAAAYVAPYLDGTAGSNVNITSSNYTTGSAGQFSWTATNASQTSTQWRLAENGSIAFTANSGYSISKVEITSTDAYPGTWSATAGTVSSKTISGINASSVTISTTSAARIQNIKVYAVTASGSSKPTVSLDPDGGNFTESVEVTITPSTGATVYYTTDATKKTDPSTTTWTAYNGSAKPTFTETTTVWVAAVKDATWSDVVEKTFTKIIPITSYDIDFETTDFDLYVNWDFTNAEVAANGANTNISAHGGTHYGTTGGKATAAIKTHSKIASPGTLSCYVSKQSGNTTSSTWYIQVSENGTDWTNAGSQSATSMDAGDWVEFSADLSEYSNVYVRLYYSGSTAVRNVDDISLEMASAVAKPSITGEDDFLTSTEVTMSCTTDGAAIYYTTTESAKATPATSGDWNAYDNSNKPSFTATTTVWAAAKKNDAWSAVAEKTFTKATILTVAEALTIIEGLDNKTATTAEYYVSGVVSTVTALTVDGTGEYYISADGTKTSELQVYKGKWVGGANFTSTDQLIEGDDVTIKGKLKKYNSYKELDQNNEVVLYKLKARLAWAGTTEGAYDASLEGANTFPTLTNTNGVDVEYSSSNGTAATIDPATGEISLAAVGQTTITASFAGNASYKANSASYTLNIASSLVTLTYNVDGGEPIDPINVTALPNPLPTTTKAGKNFGGWFTDSEKTEPAVPGTAISENTTLFAKWLDPYTVAEALAIIDAMDVNGETDSKVYVAGIITPTDRSFNNTYKSITYMISDDGTATDELKVYSGKGVSDVDFTAVTDLEDEDQVVVYGKLKKYQKNTNPIEPEMNQPNYIYSLSRKAEAGIEWGVASFDAYIGQSNTFPTLTNPNSLTVAYSSSNETAATIDPATGAITLGATPNVNTTITASFAGNSSYKAAEVSYMLNVYNPTNPGTITYEENGGSEVADVTTPVDNFPDPLPEPTKENYIFAGWWTTSTFNDGTQAVAGAPMDGDVILYAKWTEIPVWAYTYTSNVTLSGAKVKFYGESTEYDAVKAGTGSVAGSTSITVPAQATKLHFHAYGWNTENVGLTVTAPTGVTVSPATEISINKNAGIKENSPFTLAEGSTPMTDAYYVVELSGNDDEIELTFTATSGKRFVLFGVNQEGGIEPELDHITITGELTNKDYELGDELDKTGLIVTAYYTLAGAAHHDEDVTSDVVWSNDPLTGGQTSVDVTATYGGKSDTKACAINAVVVPTPEIILSESALEFSGKQYGAVANKTFYVTLKNVAAATVALSGDDAAKFSIDPAALTANGTVTVSVANTNVAGSFSATITVSDDVHAATSQTIALTLTITADEAPASTTAEWIEATEIYDGMPVLITGVNTTTSKIYAMGAQNDNNRAAVEATLNGDVLTPGNGTKAFTLVKQNDDTYAIMTSDGKYLYAASSSKNYLRTQTDVDADAKWTLSVTSASAESSSNRHIMQFNTSSVIFSCYESASQAPIKLYTPKTYTRTVSGNYGTICLPNGGILTNGALYEIAEMDYLNDKPNKIYFDEVEGGVMVAGKPYVFKPNDGETTLRVVYTDAANAPAGDYKGLYGKYTKTPLAKDDGNYILKNNQYYYVDSENVYCDANRAYIKLAEVPEYDSSKPSYSRRRIALNVNNEQVATGMENVQGDNVQCTKVLIDGQLFILRGEKMFDAKGQLVK